MFISMMMFSERAHQKSVHCGHNLGQSAGDLGLRIRSIYKRDFLQGAWIFLYSLVFHCEKPRH